MLVSLNNINKFYNGKQVLSNVSLTVDENDKIGLVGNNGCGKSTLLKILTGSVEPDRFTEKDGVISFAQKTSIGYLEQMGGLDSENTVMEEMNKVFEPVHKAMERLRDIELEIQLGDNSSADEYQQLSSWIEANDGYNTDVKIRTVLNGMGFSGEQLNRRVSGFSGGEKTRLCISKLLLEEPNLLILDEPTNHLDFKTIMWLEDYLRSYRGAVLIVSHDRYFLDKLCTSICEIERGILTRYKGNYSAFIRQREENTARREKEYEQQQKQIAKMEDYVARNLVRASTTKMAQSRRKQLEKIERIEKPFHEEKHAKINFTYAVEPPLDVLKVKNTDISVGEGANRKTLVDSVSFDVRRGEKIGIIGDNGIGKSTLLKIIQGLLPHQGTVRWNTNIKISYFEQESTNLNRELTVMEELHSRYPLLSDLEVRNLLAQVRFVGENVFKETGVISGGERARLTLVKLMLSKMNLLVLDEPTNHLDIGSREALEEALSGYDGTVICVSHDRTFISKLATRILGFDEGGALHDVRVSRIGAAWDEWREEAERLSVRSAPTAAAPAAAESNKEAYLRSKREAAEARRAEARLQRLKKEEAELDAELDTLNAELYGDAASDYVRAAEIAKRIEEIEERLLEIYEETEG